MTSTPAAASGAHHADAELARRAAAGDEAAFVAIMRRHNQLVYRTARGVLKSDAEAEDAAQDAWLQAWRALGSYRGDASLASWLVRIVVNQALARLRRKSASVIPLEAAMNPPLAEHDPTLATATEAAPEQVALRAQLRTLLEQRIDRLPEAFRLVFMLRAVEELSVEEVAQALQLPDATVRTRLFRARSLLREGLASDIDLATADAFAFDGERCDRIVANVLARQHAGAAD